MGPKSNDTCSYRRRAEGGLRQGHGGHGKVEAKTEMMMPQPRSTQSPQRLEKVSKAAPLPVL